MEVKCVSDQVQLILHCAASQLSSYKLPARYTITCVLTSLLGFSYRICPSILYWFTLSADIDDGPQRQDDEAQNDQQPDQVAVEHASAITVKVGSVVREQDQGADPPEEKETAVDQWLRSHVTNREHPVVLTSNHMHMQLDRNIKKRSNK